MYAIILLRSAVHNDCGHESVGARAARGGDLESLSICNKPEYECESQEETGHMNHYQGSMI
jgi:hypothetical protein